MPKRSRLVPTIRKPDFCPDFEWFGGHFVSTIWNPDRIFLASLDRFIRKGHKKYVFHAKTVYASNRTQMSGFWSVQYSNVRDWHKIESEYCPPFGIQWGTVLECLEYRTVRISDPHCRMVTKLDHFIYENLLDIKWSSLVTI
jgi:hypothetical protein